MRLGHKERLRLAALPRPNQGQGPLSPCRHTKCNVVGSKSPVLRGDSSRFCGCALVYPPALHNNPEIRGVPLCGKFGNGWGLAPADTYFPQRKRPWLLCLPPVNNSMDCNGLQVRADRNATLDYRAVRSMLQH